MAVLAIPEGRREPHQLAVTATGDDIDFMGHVNNARYLNWLQAAVLDHWSHIAPSGDHASTVWIALQHDIRYYKPAFSGDQVTVSVDLRDLRGARATYSTVIVRGGEVLVTIKSIWCAISKDTGKPRRLPGVLIDLLLSRQAIT